MTSVDEWNPLPAASDIFNEPGTDWIFFPSSLSPESPLLLSVNLFISSVINRKREKDSTPNGVWMPQFTPGLMLPGSQASVAGVPREVSGCDARILPCVSALQSILYYNCTIWTPHLLLSSLLGNLCAVCILPNHTEWPWKKENVHSASLKTILSSSKSRVVCRVPSFWKPLPIHPHSQGHEESACHVYQMTVLSHIGSQPGSSPPPATARLNALLDHLHPAPFDVPFSSFKIPFGGRSDSIKQNY